MSKEKYQNLTSKILVQMEIRIFLHSYTPNPQHNSGRATAMQQNQVV